MSQTDLAAPPPPPPPSKRLGRLMSFAMVVGTIVGSGIYILPAQVAPFGINLVAAFVLTGVGTMLLAISMGKMAARIAGGPYTHVARAFGDLPAFITMWCCMLSQVVGAAAVAIAVGGALGQAFPALATPLWTSGIGIASILLLTLVQMNGPRSAGRVQVAAALVKLVPLILVILIALALVAGGGPVAPLAPVPLTLAGVTAASALMLFAFTGFEAGPITANVTEKAEAAVPAATIRGTAFTALLYLATTVAVLWLLPSAIAATSPAPIADAIAGSLGNTARVLVALVGAISALGTGNALILLSVEVMRAIATAGDMPAAFARTNANGVATRALVVVAVLAIAMVALSTSPDLVETFSFVALVSAVAALVLYLVCAAAAWKLGVTGAIVAVPAILYSLAMFYGSGAEAVGYATVLALAGLPIRWLTRARRPTPPAAPAA